MPGVANLRFFGSAVVLGIVSGNNGAGTPRGMGAQDQPVFVRAGVDTLVPTTEDDGSVSLVALPRYAQYSGQCGSFGSAATPVAQDMKNNYGVECQGIRRPMDWSSSVALQSKLQYTYGSGSSVSLTGISSGDQNRNTPGTNMNDPAIYSGVHTWTRMAILNIASMGKFSSDRSIQEYAETIWKVRPVPA